MRTSYQKTFSFHFVLLIVLKITVFGSLTLAATKAGEITPQLRKEREMSSLKAASLIMEGTTLLAAARKPYKPVAVTHKWRFAGAVPQKPQQMVCPSGCAVTVAYLTGIPRQVCKAVNNYTGAPQTGRVPRAGEIFREFEGRPLEVARIPGTNVTRQGCLQGPDVETDYIYFQIIAAAGE